MSQINISEAPVLLLPDLNRMFAHAVDAHFAYFSEPVRRRVVREHTIPKLFLAAVDHRRIILVARAGDQLIGYAIGAVPQSGPAQIYWLYVDPNHRGQNTGLKLLSRMLKLQEAKGAREVSIATHDHRRYYERQGFVRVDNKMVDGVNMDILTYKIGNAA